MKLIPYKFKLETWQFQMNALCGKYYSSPSHPFLWLSWYSLFRCELRDIYWPSLFTHQEDMQSPCQTIKAHSLLYVSLWKILHIRFVAFCLGQLLSSGLPVKIPIAFCSFVTNNNIFRNLMLEFPKCKSLNSKALFRISICYVTFVSSFIILSELQNN